MVIQKFCNINFVGQIIRQNSRLFSSSASMFSQTPWDNSKIGIIGVPFDKGQQKNSIKSREGPKAIRNGGLIEEIKLFNSKIDIKDYGDVDVCLNSVVNDKTPPKNMRNYFDVIRTNKNLSDKIQQVLNDKRLCITLGGDHSIGLGSLDGHLKFNNDVITFWIDAHTDINTNATSYTGNVHGMPVALLAKELDRYWPANMPELEWIYPKLLSLKNIVYIGQRSVDPCERFIAHKYNIQLYGMEEVDKYGIVDIMEMALKKIDPNNEKFIHISFDIDSLDELEAPSTGTPVRGGLTLREGSYIVERLRQTGRLQAIDLVEVNPSLGSLEDVKRTVDASIQILKSACGLIRGGNVPDTCEEIPILK